MNARTILLGAILIFSVFISFLILWYLTPIFRIISHKDSTPPTIVLVSPENFTIHRSGIPIQFNVSDYHLHTVWYAWDFSAYHILQFPFIVFLPPLDGPHLLRISANDSRGNLESKTYLFITDDTYPTIELIDPENGSVHSSGYLINLSISDTHLNTVLYAWDLNTSLTFSPPYDLFLPVGDGPHWLFIVCNDTAGNTINSQYLFITDDTPPIITLNYPANNSVRKSGTIIDLFISDDHLSTVLYHWTDQPNASLSAPYCLFLPSGDGKHALWIYANDTLGATSRAFFQFTTDDTSPIITLLNHLNDTHIDAGFRLNFSMQDSNPSFLLYHWDSEENITLYPPFCIEVPANAGIHCLYIYAFDLADNCAPMLYRFDISVPNPIPSFEFHILIILLGGFGLAGLKKFYNLNGGI